MSRTFPPIDLMENDTCPMKSVPSTPRGRKMPESPSHDQTPARMAAPLSNGEALIWGNRPSVQYCNHFAGNCGQAYPISNDLDVLRVRREEFRQVTPCGRIPLWRNCHEAELPKSPPSFAPVQKTRTRGGWSCGDSKKGSRSRAGADGTGMGPFDRLGAVEIAPAMDGFAP
jgi:hypothetical protein